MALSDLAVYSEFAYESMTEVLRQQTDLFNEATGGALVLNPAMNVGDFNQSAFYGRVSGGLVRRRNAYGSGAVSEKSLGHKEDVTVKVAAGTAPIRIDPGQFAWIQRNAEEAGVILGQQLAKDAIADMLNTGLGACQAALSGVSGVIYDATANSAAADKLPTWANLNNGQALFGDASASIVAWLMHSAPMHKLYANGLANAERLFSFGNVNVVRDPFGKLLIMTDSPSLFVAGTPNTYSILGLVTGGVAIDQNSDFMANEETKNGDENIIRTYQAEWSYNVGVKGFAWDKANGGKSPTDSALFTSTNWDKYATSNKDLAGVLVKTN